MIGAGNVAWHLSQALKKANYIPIGVYSRHKTKAEALAEEKHVIIGCHRRCL